MWGGLPFWTLRLFTLQGCHAWRSDRSGSLNIRAQGRPPACLVAVLETKFFFFRLSQSCICFIIHHSFYISSFSFLSSFSLHFSFFLSLLLTPFLFVVFFTPVLPLHYTNIYQHLVLECCSLGECRWFSPSSLMHNSRVFSSSQQHRRAMEQKEVCLCSLETFFQYAPQDIPCGLQFPS